MGNGLVKKDECRALLELPSDGSDLDGLDADALRAEVVRVRCAAQAALRDWSASPQSSGEERPLSAGRAGGAVRLSAAAKLERLRTMDPFVLDNSLRETTVAQPRGHSIEDKFRILEAVRSTGLTHMIVGALGRLKRVDDVFLSELRSRGEDRRHMYLFSELADGVDADTRRFSREVPVALRSAQACGIPNVIIEIDLAAEGVDWDAEFAADSDSDSAKASAETPYLALLHERVRWVRQELSPEARVFFNFRDWLVAWKAAPQRVLRVAESLARAPAEQRVTVVGFCVEDPFGIYLPFQYEEPMGSLRRTMDDNGWAQGHILVHIHKNYGLAEASVLEALALGGTGVWCAVPDEGAAVGHACSCVLLTNLARLGNERVKAKYDFPALREAAIEITLVTTNALPHPRTEVYGARALDFIFEGISTANDPLQGFDVNTLFGLKRQTRISTLATPQMHRDRLEELFGEEPPERAAFAADVCARMPELLHADLQAGREEEYQSAVGLLALFQRSGGAPTEKMLCTVERLQAHPLLAQLKDYFESWDCKDAADGSGNVKDDRIDFDHFYDGFMAKYVSCYSCEQARGLFAAIDLNHDNAISWREIALRAQWALAEYPENIASLDDLIAVVMQKYLLPSLLQAKANAQAP